MEKDQPAAGGRPARRMVRGSLMIGGLALAANAGWLAVTANLNLGTALVALVALLLIACGVWYPWLRRATWVGTIALLVSLAVLGMSSFLAAQGTIDNAGSDEEAVIVLGAAVHGREPSRTLIGRLDAALAYRQRNPDAVLVVAGGQGPQEDIPEAVAMRDYLVAQGVPASEILLEDRSTSTEENFAFAKNLLDQRLEPGYRVVFVTDEFHVYRAGRIAAAAGFTATHVSSRTPWYFWPANYLRETVAIVIDWLSR